MITRKRLTAGVGITLATLAAGLGTAIPAAADGTYLPLACTLNCTLAVDKVAALLGL
ncbi:hypothetical protein JHN48_28720, partial [Streptomyces sp. MBT72]|nr:hypothetical protein [Streptomyces sp. MBT72]